MTIHSTSVRPLVDELGQDIEPAKATNFAIEKVKLSRLIGIFSSMEPAKGKKYLPTGISSPIGLWVP